MTAGALAAAWRFLPLAWRRAGLVLAAGAVSAAFAGTPGLAGWCDCGLLLVLALVGAGATWRLALGAGPVGPGGFQMGAMEARLAAAGVLRWIFLVIVFLLAFTALLAVAYAGASAGHGFVASDVRTWSGAADARGRALMGAAAVACAGFWLWAQARTALASAASTARGKVQVLASWPLTRRHAVTVLSVQAGCAAAPALVLAAAMLLPGRFFMLIAGAAILGLWLPLTAGAGAYLYRSLEPQDPSRPG